MQTLWCPLGSAKCRKADYYADAVLLNIAYYLDPDHPAEAISWARFYSGDKYNWDGMVTEYLPYAVANELPANQQYLRYWHGSLTIIRPLLMWFDLREIYRILGALLFVLLGGIVTVLVRKGFLKEAAAFILALTAVSVWYVPVCLEYIWMFLVMAAASLITIYLSLGKKYQRMPVFFFCVGMISVFLDFFTTETLTLLIPLLFMYMVLQRQGAESPDWVLGFRCAVLWGVGYVGMWITKWAFAAAVLQENTMPYVRSSVMEHLGAAGQVSLWQLCLRSVRNNVFELFTFSYGMPGAVLTLVLFFCLIFLPVVLNRITLKKQIRKQWVLLFLLAGAVPFLRFAAIPGHSAGYSWFTFRALAASVMAWIMAFRIPALCFVRQSSFLGLAESGRGADRAVPLQPVGGGHRDGRHASLVLGDHCSAGCCRDHAL